MQNKSTEVNIRYAGVFGSFYVPITVLAVTLICKWLMVTSIRLILTTKRLMQRANFPSDTGVRSVAPNIAKVDTMVLTTVIAGLVQWVIWEPRYVSQYMRIGCLAVPSLALITTGCSVGNARVIPSKNVIATTSLWKTATLTLSVVHHIAVSTGCICLKTKKWFDYQYTNNLAGLTPVLRTTW